MRKITDRDIYVKIKEIADLHSYDEDTIALLCATVPTMVKYYGEEHADRIFETLTEVPIELGGLGRNAADAAKEQNQPGVTYTWIGEEESPEAAGAVLTLAAGVYASKPILEEQNGSFVVAGKSRTIFVNKSENASYMMGTFIHEVSHAIKSQVNEFSLEEDKDGKTILTTRCGLQQIRSYIYKDENEALVVADFQNDNLGIEEGINAWDELQMMNIILSNNISPATPKAREMVEVAKKSTGGEYKLGGYVALSKIAGTLLRECGYEADIRGDQFNATNNFESKFDEQAAQNGTSTFETLNNYIDKEVKLSYETFNSLFSDNLDEIVSKRKENIQKIRAILNATKAETSPRKDVGYDSV